jgi:hypothetical protein
MFLFGIIPGPSEPPLTCLNHYLRILVDMLLEFWFTGIRFSRTWAYYYGRVVWCALICVVSDLLAARKISGFASIHHTQMCALCHCTRAQQDSLNDSFATLGKRRTNEDIRNSAQLYLDAADEKKRDEAVRNSGIRWSELHRLPYFDTSRFVVVDAMHNLFLGLVQEHFDILGIKLNNTKSRTTQSIVIKIPEESINTLNEHERKSAIRLINILEAPIKKELKLPAGYEVYFKRLSALHRAPLELLCTSVGAPLKQDPKHVNKSKFNKPDFIHAILAWVRYFSIPFNALYLSGPYSDCPKLKFPRTLPVEPFLPLRRWPSFGLTSKTWSLLPGSRQFQLTSVNQAMASSRQINGVHSVQLTFLFRLFGYGTNWRMATMGVPSNARSCWK